MLLRTLVAEHLGCEPDDVPEDPHELFDAMVACADALDEWYDGGSPDKQSGIRGRLKGRLPHRVAPVPRRGRPISRVTPSVASGSGSSAERAARRPASGRRAGCAGWRRPS